MGGSADHKRVVLHDGSAPRVHGWFQGLIISLLKTRVCPACAWVVPSEDKSAAAKAGLPRVCMGGSDRTLRAPHRQRSAPRVHG